MPQPSAVISRIRGWVPERFLHAEAAKDIGRILARYGLVGVLSGVVAAAFQLAVLGMGDALFTGTTGINPAATGWGTRESGISLPDAARFWILLIVPLGALLAGLIAARFAPEAMGAGTMLVIDAYHRQSGLLRGRIPAVKFAASVATVGSGGSAGVEGPVGAIAAGVGSLFGRLTGADAPEQRRLLMAGFAAGVGAVFHTPMGASILAAEVLYRDLDMEHEVLVPAIIASTVAYGTFGVLAGWEPIWLIPPVGFDHIIELLPYLALAIVAALSGQLFISLQKLVRDTLGRAHRIPLWLRPAIGGLGVAIIALFVPDALGGGYGMAQAAIDGSVGVGMLLGLALVKMVASALTTSSGGSGGVFAPSLVIGGALGAAVALSCNAIWPALDLSPAAFAIVGMAGFFSTVINAPISTVIMVSELAGSYRLLVPTLWVAIIAWSLNRHHSVFTDQIRSRLEAPGHLADMMDAVLRRIPVREAMTRDAPPPVTVPPAMPLRELVQIFASSQQAVFPVVDGLRLCGVVDGRQLRRTIGAVGIDELLIARDFQAEALTISGQASLHEAVGKMTASGYDDILVVAEGDGERLLGLLSRREIVNAYHRRMLQTAPGAAAMEEASSDGPPGAEPRRLDLISALERGGLLVGLDVSGDGAESPREAVLRAIVTEAQLPDICSRESLLQRLLERETLGSTNIGGGLALPHPGTHTLGGLEDPRVFIALLKRPIQWADGDDEPVDTVCMLLAPEGEVHLGLVGSLARSLGDPALQSLLHDRASETDIMARFRELARLHAS